MIAPMRCSSRAISYSQLRLRFFIILGCLGLIGSGSLFAGAKSPINLTVLARDGYGVVSIARPRPNDLVVRGSINGRNVTLILDTGWGAPGISLDSSFGKSLKLATQPVKGHGISNAGVAMSVEKAIADTVVLGNVQLTAVPLFVGTFRGLRNEQIREAVWASGFVGAGFLHANSAILDLPNFCLYLRPPGKGRLAVLGPALRAVGFSEVPFTMAGDQCLVDVEFNGVGAKMIIDTGATYSGVDSRFASQIKARGYDARVASIDAAGVVKQVQVTSTSSLRLAGVPVRAPELTLGTFSCYPLSGGKIIGLLGMDVLGQNWGMIDFGNRKLYVSKAK